mgnify:CR=1 FL=1
MIYVYLLGHDFRYEVQELIKVFFFGEDIIFIDNKNQYDKGILIENSLYYTDKKFNSTTKIYRNNKLIFKHTVGNIEDLRIEGENIKKKIRIGIKKCIYEALISISDTLVPWGVLTGIRPVKIAHSLLGEGLEDKEILNILTEQYRLFLEKANLILGISKKQRKYIYPLDDNRFSLYVSIPFCPTRCLYCSFPSCGIERYGNFVDNYTDNLIYEIDRISELMENKSISTVYIGGGTPTAIPTNNLEKIIQAIYKKFGRENIEEITVEAGRPDTINRQILEMLNKNEIDRISINPQTMNDGTLRLIGRKHNSEPIIAAYYLAKEIGFDVINMDLIIGLPSEGLKEVKTTLKEIEKLNPENLTVHTLSVKRGSKFKDSMEKYHVGSQKVIEKMLNETRYFASRMNLKPYYLYRQKQTMGNFENIGYAKEGKECIYNIAMMEEKETIVAAGMGAVSKIFFPKENRIERIPNVKSLEEYLKRTEEMVERKANILEYK